jgi:hypothetical protein
MRRVFLAEEQSGARLQHPHIVPWLTTVVEIAGALHRPGQPDAARAAYERLVTRPSVRSAVREVRDRLGRLAPEPGT